MRETLLSFFQPPISPDSEQSTAKLAWVIRLRWIALLAQLLSIPPALEFQLLEWELLPYYGGVIASLAILNVASWALLRRAKAPATGRAVLFQLSTDIAVLSALLALTGGAWNPLVPILFVHAGIGALMLEGSQSLLFFAFLIGCLVALQGFSYIPPGLEGVMVPAEILFPAQLVVALVFWILTAWLSRTLQALQQHVATNRERKTRIDRLRAVGALAAGLSHEFATPLNTAKLKISRLGRRPELSNDSDLATASEALDRCEDVLRHMAGAPLRPEGLDLEEVEVDELVRQVCSSVSQVNEATSIEFHRAGTSSWRALLPTLAFSQAVLNLIDNALESGTQSPVEVWVDSRPGQIDVSVLDHGGGWPEVVRAHFGQPFVTTKPDGVGLGLYFVHNLSEALGARFQLEDRRDGGAIARLSIPSLPILTPRSDGLEASA